MIMITNKADVLLIIRDIIKFISVLVQIFISTLNIVDAYNILYEKSLLLLLGGMLLMTSITGCSNTPNKKSKEEIESLFIDLMSVFLLDNYEFLYYNEGDDSNLPEGDLGSCIIYRPKRGKST